MAVIGQLYIPAAPGRAWATGTSPYGLWCPGGIIGASTPNNAALQIVGDLDIQCRVQPKSWLTGLGQFIVAKGSVNYGLAIGGSGALVLLWNDGTTSHTAQSTVAVPFAPGQAVWIRATIDVDNGATGRTITFYTSTDTTQTSSGVTWTQLGAPVVQAGVTAIVSQSNALTIGGWGTTSETFAGRILRVVIRNGIGGTAVAGPDFTASSEGWDVGDTGTATGTDTTGRVFTINGTARILSTFDIIGDIDIRWYGSLDDWITGLQQALVGRWEQTIPQRSYILRINTDGKLVFSASTDGSGFLTNINSSLTPAFANGEPIGLRVTRVAATGVVTFYTSTDSGVTWVQYGTTSVMGAGSTLWPGTSPLEVGSRDGTSAGGSLDTALGTHWWAEVREGIDGRVIASPDFRVQDPAVSSFSDGQANAWTVVSPAEIIGKAVFGFAGRWGPELFVNGNFRLLRNKPVTVYLRGTTTLAALYTDRTKTALGVNPFTTDALGNGTFFAEPGEYDILYDGLTLQITVQADPGDVVLGGGGGGGTVDGDKGDIVVSGLGTAWAYKPGSIVDADINGAAAIALSKLAVNPVARANHTGTQSADTVVDGTTNKVLTGGAQTLSGIKTFGSIPLVPDDAYSAVGWDANLGVPTKNAIRDKIESLAAGVGVTDGDKGDIVVSSSGAVWSIDTGVIVDADINPAAAIALSKLATNPVARANHTGTQSADTLTDGTTNKAFLATERTKLTGVATGATANDTDTNLKNRANHTGTQLASTVSDFDGAAENAIDSAITLRKWRAGMGHRNDQPIDILVVADSLGELGAGSSLNARWLNKLPINLARTLGGTVGGYGIYFPTMFGVVITRQAGDPWTTTGGSATYQTGGLGMRAWTGTSGANQATCSFFGNRITLCYQIAASAATAVEMVIDGVVAATVNFRTGTAQWGAQWDSGALLPGYHTLVVRNASGTFTGNFTVEGAMVEIGNRTGMVRVWDCSQSGYSAATFADPAQIGKWTDGLDLINPDLVVLMLGANDKVAGRTPVNVTTDLTTIVNAIQTQADPDASILCAIEWGRGLDAAGSWDPYAAQIRSVANSSGWAIADMDRAAGPLQSDPLLLTTDLVHPSEAGANFVSDLFCRKLNVRPTIENYPATVSTVKTLDRAVANSTLANDNELFFSVGPKERWTGRAVIFYGGTPATDLKFQFAATGTTLVTPSYYAGRGVADAATASTSFKSFFNVFGTSATVGAISAEVESLVIDFSFTTGATAGVINFMWSQAVTDAANAMFVFSGSFIEAHRVLD